MMWQKVVIPYGFIQSYEPDCVIYNPLNVKQSALPSRRGFGRAFNLLAILCIGFPTIWLANMHLSRLGRYPQLQLPSDRHARFVKMVV
jgi:hypothetical protein